MNFKQIIGNITATIFPVRTIRGGYGSGLKISSKNSSADYSGGKNEYPVQQVIARYLKQGDVFYDIGANVGFFSLIAARLVGASGQVYAFEPVPANASLIQKNAEINNLRNITVFQKAISDNNGKGDLIQTEHPGGAKLSVVDTPLNSPIKMIIPVEVISIDGLLINRDILPPKLVKIDVEGAEIQVLKGMSTTIGKYKPLVIYEVDHKNKDEFMFRIEQIDAFINEFGYKLKILEDSYPNINWYVRHAVAFPEDSFLSDLGLNDKAGMRKRTSKTD